MDFLLQVIELTGLPKDAVESEMTALLKEHGLTRDQLTIEILREILASYLQDTLIKAKSEVEFSTET